MQEEKTRVLSNTQNKTFDIPPRVIYHIVHCHSHRKGVFSMESTMKIHLCLAAILVAGTLSADNFNNLFRVMSPHGDCQIKRPGQEMFEPVVKGKAYPFGAQLKCGSGSDMLVAFSEGNGVRMMAGSLIEVILDREAGNCRVISLKQGGIMTRVEVANTNMTVVVDTPVGRCVSMVGNAKFHLSSTPTTHSLDIKADAAFQAKIIGPQYIIPNLRPSSGDSVSISSLADNSMTTIHNTKGDYNLIINKGLDMNPDISGWNNETAPNPMLSSFSLLPGETVKIWREKAPIGGRLVVSILITGPEGKGRGSFAFAVGQPAILAASNVFGDLPEASGNDAADASAASDNYDDLFSLPTDEGVPASEVPAAEESAPDTAVEDFPF